MFAPLSGGPPNLLQLSLRRSVLPLVFSVPLMPLQLAAQAPSRPPLLPLSEPILARIPADYRAEAKAQIRQTGPAIFANAGDAIFLAPFAGTDAKAAGKHLVEQAQ